MRTIRLLSRLAVVLGASLTLVGLLCGTASASQRPDRAVPTLTRSEAKFKIPSDGANYWWTMTLYTCAASDYRCRVTLLGTTTARWGTIELKVPPAPGCTYQINIERGKHFYSGQRDTFTPCSTSAPTTSSTSSTTSTTRPRTSGTSGGGTTATSGGGQSGTSGGTTPTTPTGSLAFTGPGVMLDVLAGIGALLVLAGIAVLWYLRPRRPAVSYWR
jgi:hypothetical protein